MNRVADPLIIRPAAPEGRGKLREAIVDCRNMNACVTRRSCPAKRLPTPISTECSARAKTTSDAVLVAERADSFLGFVAGWIEQTNNLAKTADSNRLGYISDICVLPACWGPRIAAHLLDGIEQYFRRAGAQRLRINSLAVNTSAQVSYKHDEFRPYEILYEKESTKAGGHERAG